MLSSDRYGPAMVLYGVNEHRKVQFFIKEKKKKKIAGLSCKRNCFL